ncbi:MAG: LamG domain-containing protein [Planctomycetes bacterium]|nr:LamG domain-containing protein [Planctomycetota bacterium]
MGSTQWHRMWHLVSVFVLLVTVPCWAGEAKQEARPSKPARPDEPTVDAPLLAHWTFDEHGGDATVIREASEKPELIVRTKQPVPRTRGVYGNALDLRGAHALPTAIGAHLKDVSRITISAWVMPSDLSGYREIFRQECRERVLFSFQNSGTILSLGLNVNGYAECDAAINPSQILNGRWHHCAATFDGKIMRVYLDGKEVGSMKRSGKLLTQSAAPAFIGSLNGASEHFQGALDDLRIYREALTAKQIALLHRHGERSIDASFKRFDEQIARFFVPGKTLGATLAATQAKLAKTGQRLEGDLAMAVLRRLESTHREEYAKFLEHLGASPLEYLTAKDNRFIAKKARRLVTLLVEYKPLTDSQWKCQTPEQLLKWKTHIRGNAQHIARDAAEGAQKAAGRRRQSCLARCQRPPPSQAGRHHQQQRVRRRPENPPGQSQVSPRAEHRGEDLHLLAQAAVFVDRSGGFGGPIRRRQARAGHGAD